ncbi:MAG TPA: VOC family protein [Chloroflexota bacterium]|nr:VOC family protein [Chloroflexota bacterium]
MAFEANIEQRGFAMDPLVERRVRRRLASLGRRLAHHPEPRAVPRLWLRSDLRRLARTRRVLGYVGFELPRRQDAADGTVLHAEVRRGAVVLMVASTDAAYLTRPLVGRSVGDGLYLWFAQASAVDAWYSQARAAGGRGVIPPEDTEWGTRRARVLDPRGKEWSAGTYQPGAAW